METRSSTKKNLILPDLFTSSARRKSTTPAEWRSSRRPEILDLFRTHVYGRTPSAQVELNVDVYDEDSNALNGQAIRKQVAIDVSVDDKSLRMELLMYLPKSARREPVPVMLLLNFGGNHTILIDPAIALPKSQVRDDYSPPEKFRGRSKNRHPVSEIVSRGYGIATAYYGDIDPDFHDEFKNGVHPLFDQPGQRPEDAWGSVAGWAWGLSRFMDYLETDRDVDPTKVAVLGHSRLGKAALWAGAQDERFSIVISNNSGCTGAALSRQKRGETIAAINKQFPHWFCKNYRAFNENEDHLPVDQHQLLSLIAPRPVYVASASEDLWADPEGEFLSCVHAGQAYELFGLEGLGTHVFPDPGSPSYDGHIGYHLRAGKHNLMEYDWNCFMDFTDKHWKRCQQGHADTGVRFQDIGNSTTSGHG